MRRTRFLIRSAAGFAALGMTLGSTANAAATSFQGVDPLVAVSLFGSTQSSRVVCNPESAAQTGTAAGCVHQAAYAGQPAPAADGYYDSQSVSGGIGVLPILGGLAAIAIVAVLLLNDDEDGRINLPISP
jgi:hypothetical protein